MITIISINEPRHDKTNKVNVRPTKTQISLGIRPVWSESSLSAWRNLGSLATHWSHSEDSDQSWRTPRLIWVFAGRTLILLVLSCRGSNGSLWVQDVVRFSCVIKVMAKWSDATCHMNLLNGSLFWCHDDIAKTSALFWSHKYFALDPRCEQTPFWRCLCLVRTLKLFFFLH